MTHEIISLLDGGTVHIHTLGRSVLVRAVADSVESANDYLSKHRGTAVIAQAGPLVFIAEYGDLGKKLPKGFSE